MQTQLPLLEVTYNPLRCRFIRLPIDFRFLILPLGFVCLNLRMGLVAAYVQGAKRAGAGIRATLSVNIVTGKNYLHVF